MRRCPKCGYVDPAAVEAEKRYEKTRESRAAYMREYRKRRKKKRKE